MAFRLSLGRRDRDRSSDAARGEGCFGLALSAFGGLVAWAGISDHGWLHPVTGIGLGVCCLGLWLAGARRVLRVREPFRLLGGFLCGGAALACLGMAVPAALRTDAVPAAFLFLVGCLWALAAVMALDLQRRLLPGLTSTSSDQALGGAVAILAGGVICLQALGGLGDGGHLGPALLAGSVFFLAGVILLLGAFGLHEADGLLHRTLVALLLTAFTAVACLFPPGALFVAVFAAMAWVAVYRAVHQAIAGRDPLAHLSDAQHLGLGCAIVVALGLLGGLSWLLLRSSETPHEPASVETPLPLEAPDPAPAAPPP